MDTCTGLAETDRVVVAEDKDAMVNSSSPMILSKSRQIAFVERRTAAMVDPSTSNQGVQGLVRRGFAENERVLDNVEAARRIGKVRLRWLAASPVHFVILQCCAIAIASTLPSLQVIACWRTHSLTIAIQTEASLDFEKRVASQLFVQRALLAW